MSRNRVVMEPSVVMSFSFFLCLGGRCFGVVSSQRHTTGENAAGELNLTGKSLFLKALRPCGLGPFGRWTLCVYNNAPDGQGPRFMVLHLNHHFLAKVLSLSQLI